MWRGEGEIDSDWASYRARGGFRVFPQGSTMSAGLRSRDDSGSERRCPRHRPRGSVRRWSSTTTSAPCFAGARRGGRGRRDHVAEVTRPPAATQEDGSSKKQRRRARPRAKRRPHGRCRGRLPFRCLRRWRCLDPRPRKKRGRDPGASSTSWQLALAETTARRRRPPGRH